MFLKLHSEGNNMILRPNYSNADIKNDSYILLLLDFNQINADSAKQIMNKVAKFVKENLHCENCHYVFFDSKGKMKIRSDINVNDIGINETCFSISGMILPNKRLIKRLMNERYFFSNPAIAEEKDLLKYLEKDEVVYYTHNTYDDFEISFSRRGWDEKFSFECSIRVNCYSVKYNYDELIKYYNELIIYFSRTAQLFAAYVDYDGFLDEPSLIYEYCYGFQESEDEFKELRTFPWCVYLSNVYLQTHPTLTTKAKRVLSYKKIENGCILQSDCKLKDFNSSQRTTVFNVLKEFLPKSYGVKPIEYLMCSGFKPCDSTAYIFEEFGNKYIVFSNGVSLENIVLDLQEQYFKYVKTISINISDRDNTGDGTMCSAEE